MPLDLERLAIALDFVARSETTELYVLRTRTFVEQVLQSALDTRKNDRESFAGLLDRATRPSSDNTVRHALIALSRLRNKIAHELGDHFQAPEAQRFLEAAGVWDRDCDVGGAMKLPRRVFELTVRVTVSGVIASMLFELGLRDDLLKSPAARSGVTELGFAFMSHQSRAIISASAGISRQLDGLFTRITAIAERPDISEDAQ